MDSGLADPTPTPPTSAPQSSFGNAWTQFSALAAGGVAAVAQSAKPLVDIAGEQSGVFRIAARPAVVAAVQSEAGATLLTLAGAALRSSWPLLLVGLKGDGGDQAPAKPAPEVAPFVDPNETQPRRSMFLQHLGEPGTGFLPLTAPQAPGVDARHRASASETPPSQAAPDSAPTAQEEGGDAAPNKPAESASASASPKLEDSALNKPTSASWQDPPTEGVEAVTTATALWPGTGTRSRLDFVFCDVSADFKNDGQGGWSLGTAGDPNLPYVSATVEGGTLKRLVVRPQPDGGSDPNHLSGSSLTYSLLKRLDSEGIRINAIETVDPNVNGRLFQNGEFKFVEKRDGVALLTRTASIEFEPHGEMTDFGVVFTNLGAEAKPPTVYTGDITKGRHSLIYVVVVAGESGERGELVLGNPRDPFYRSNEDTFHSDLAGGRQILAAGEVSIEDGKLMVADNVSGHYRPYGDWAMAKSLGAFAAAGLDIRGARYVENFSAGLSPLQSRRYFDMSDTQWHAGAPPIEPEKPIEGGSWLQRALDTGELPPWWPKNGK
ncbi:MAG: hypothetical protein H7Y33_09000 [Cytophagales bacterium]|nr:hypothetical protein [Rhizobacter sp.]